MNLHPDPSLLRNSKVSYRLNGQVGLAHTNYTKTIQGPEVEVILDPDDCLCKAYRTANSLDIDGHVVSTDPEALREFSLQRLWLSGHPMGFRKQSRPGLRNTWNEQPRSRIVVKVISTPGDCHDEEWIAQGCLSEEGVDKSAHDLMYVCRTIYRAWLKRELETSTTYEAVTESDEEIWDRHVTARFRRAPQGSDEDALDLRGPGCAHCKLTLQHNGDPRHIELPVGCGHGWCATFGDAHP